MFTRVARYGSLLAAHPLATTVALVLFVGWLVAEAIANHRAADFMVGAATVVTLVLVFMLQHAQYHDTRALHAKIDELILSLEGPRDQLAGIEHRALDELNDIHKEADADASRGPFGNAAHG